MHKIRGSTLILNKSGRGPPKKNIHTKFATNSCIGLRDDQKWVNPFGPNPEYSRGKMTSFIGRSRLYSGRFTCIQWPITSILWQISICVRVYLMISYKYHILQNKNKHI